MKKIQNSMLVLLLVTMHSVWSQKENPPLRLIELVTLQKGFALDDHLAYAKEIEPILNRNQMHQLTHFKVLKKASGTVADHVVKVGVYALPSPQALQGVFEDATYNRKFVPKRDKIHDMGHMTFFMAKPIFEKNHDPKKMVIVDFIVMNEGHSTKERNAYFKKLEKIGKKHGLRRFASYEVLKFMRGTGPSGASLVNLYEVGPDTFKNLIEDPQYQTKMVPTRNEIFNMAEVSVLMTQPLH